MFSRMEIFILFADGRKRFEIVYSVEEAWRQCFNYGGRCWEMA